MKEPRPTDRRSRQSKPADGSLAGASSVPASRRRGAAKLLTGSLPMAHAPACVIAASVADADTKSGAARVGNQPITGVNAKGAATAKSYGDDAPYIFTEPRIVDDFSIGVLRRNFSGRVNDSVDFVRRKLHPRPGNVPPFTWLPNAYRHDVLLPAGAADMLIDPRLLMEQSEQSVLDDQTALLIAIKVTAPDTDLLHRFWERARMFAWSEFVEQRGLPVIMVMHLPQKSGAQNPNEPHIHLLAPVRRLGARGFGGMCSITSSRSQPELVAAWIATKS